MGSGPSTGYAWQLPSLPEGVLLLGRDFVQATQAAIGDGGVQVFHLQTRRPGRFSLQFLRERAWETEAIETRPIDVDAR